MKAGIGYDKNYDKKVERDSSAAGLSGWMQFIRYEWDYISQPLRGGKESGNYG